MLKMVMSRRSVDSFCLIVLKYFVGEPFCVVLQKISGFFPNLPSGSERFYAQEDYIPTFCQNFLSHRAEFFVEQPFCVSQKLWYRKKLRT